MRRRIARPTHSSPAHVREDTGPMRILLVEDHAKLAGLLRRGMGEEGITAEVVGRGADGIWRASEAAYDVLVLDVMLPALDGLEVCRRLREADVRTPVLSLT